MIGLLLWLWQTLVALIVGISSAVLTAIAPASSSAPPCGDGARAGKEVIE